MPVETAASPDVREQERLVRLDVRLRFFGSESDGDSMPERALHLLRSAFPHVEVWRDGQQVHEHDWFTGEIID